MEVSIRGGLGLTEGSMAGEVGMVGGWEGGSSVLGENDTGEGEEAMGESGVVAVGSVRRKWCLGQGGEIQVLLC
jgi:hypothetical protein